MQGTGFNFWVRKIPWRRKWQPTPVFLPGEAHGQRILEGYSPWGCKELDTTECTCACTCNQMIKGLRTEKALGTLVTSLVLSPQDSFPFSFCPQGSHPQGTWLTAALVLSLHLLPGKRENSRKVLIGWLVCMGGSNFCDLETHWRDSWG